MNLAAIAGVVAIVSALSAAPARAAMPIPPFGAKTSAVVITNATTATVNGLVTRASWFQAVYDLGSSTWCTSNGAAGAPAFSTPQQRGGSSLVAVNLTGLGAGVRYCAAIMATSSTGATATGALIGFTAGAPGARTDGVVSVSATTAALSGAVTPSGQTTTYRGVFDLASSTWCASNGASGAPAHSTPAQTLGYTDTSAHSVSLTLPGLSTGSKYCAAISASTPAASTLGAVSGFTAGAPTTTAYHLSYRVLASGATAPIVNGTVNPSGQTTSYTAVYDLATSAWCGSNGASGTPANSTPAKTLAYTDGTAHSVSVNLPALAAGTSYCATIKASNPAATAAGAPLHFVAEAPAVLTTGVSAVGSTTATINGAVNPGGQDGTYYEAVYDVATSPWCRSNGAVGSPTMMWTGGQALGYADSTLHPVAVTVNVTAGTKYCAEISADNAVGAARGTVSGVIVYFTATTP